MFAPKEEVIETVLPWVRYSLDEAHATGVPQAMLEIAAIMFLLGRGLDPQSAYRLVESMDLDAEDYSLYSHHFR